MQRMQLSFSTCLIKHGQISILSIKKQNISNTKHIGLRLRRPDVYYCAKRFLFLIWSLGTQDLLQSIKLDSHTASWPQILVECIPAHFCCSCVFLPNFKKCTILGLFKTRDAYSIFSFQYHLPSIWPGTHVIISYSVLNMQVEKKKKKPKEPKSQVGLWSS